MSGGSFDVVTSELGDAAGQIDRSVSLLNGWTLPAAATASFGHAGLAAAHSRMSEGAAAAVASGVASSQRHGVELRASAALYGLQDAAAAVGFGSLSGSPAGHDG